jgi:hypothetical protein
MDWQLLQALALADINQNLVVQENEGAASVVLTPSTVNGFNSGALPADFCRPRAVFSGSGELDPVDIQGLIARGALNGFFAISGGKIFCADAGPISLVYSTRTGPLIADADINTVSDLYATVLLYGLLVQATQQIQDFDALQAHQAAFESAMGTANAAYAFATLTAGAAPRSPYAQVRN